MHTLRRWTALLILFYFISFIAIVGRSWANIRQRSVCTAKREFVNSVQIAIKWFASWQRGEFLPGAPAGASVAEVSVALSYGEWEVRGVDGCISSGYLYTEIAFVGTSGVWLLPVPRFRLGLYPFSTGNGMKEAQDAKKSENSQRYARMKHRLADKRLKRPAFRAWPWVFLPSCSSVVHPHISVHRRRGAVHELLLPSEQVSPCVNSKS